MMKRIYSTITMAISEYRKNPLSAMSEGVTVAVLNHNQPAFYCVPVEEYERLIQQNTATPTPPPTPLINDDELRIILIMKEDELYSYMVATCELDPLLDAAELTSIVRVCTSYRRLVAEQEAMEREHNGMTPLSSYYSGLIKIAESLLLIDARTSILVSQARQQSN